jgi:pimeloyl-ACP methyl ester carboxylesterase
MSELLLIHGACLGAWIWDRVIPDLTALGHTARAIDLPGRNSLTTLPEQVAAIESALRGPTLLVGHSAGGFAITAAAQTGNPLIRGLIYVCAYVPRRGQSLAQMRRAGPSQPLAPAFRVALDRKTFRFDPALAEVLFFHDCPEPMAQGLCAESVAPMETALPDTARAEALPRAYITCAKDRAIPPAYQNTMATGIALRAELPCGHAPFLALPDRLAACISDFTTQMS